MIALTKIMRPREARFLVASSVVVLGGCSVVVGGITSVMA
jgi:hypothetical protein